MKSATLFRTKFIVLLMFLGSVVTQGVRLQKHERGGGCRTYSADGKQGPYLQKKNSKGRSVDYADQCLGMNNKYATCGAYGDYGKSGGKCCCQKNTYLKNSCKKDAKCQNPI